MASIKEIKSFFKALTLPKVTEKECEGDPSKVDVWGRSDTSPLVASLYQPDDAAWNLSADKVLACAQSGFVNRTDDVQREQVSALEFVLPNCPYKGVDVYQAIYDATDTENKQSVLDRIANYNTYEFNPTPTIKAKQLLEDRANLDPNVFLTKALRGRVSGHLPMPGDINIVETALNTGRVKDYAKFLGMAMTGARSVTDFAPFFDLGFGVKEYSNDQGDTSLIELAHFRPDSLQGLDQAKMDVLIKQGIALGVDPNAKNKAGTVNEYSLYTGTPLLVELVRNQWNPKVLLDNQAVDPTLKTASGVSGTMEAARTGQLDSVKQFVANPRAKAAINDADEFGNTAFLTAAASPKASVELMSVLKSAGASANAVNKKGETALMLAAEIDSIEHINYLDGVAPELLNMRLPRADGPGINALSFNKNIDVSLRLLELGVDPNSSGSFEKFLPWNHQLPERNSMEKFGQLVDKMIEKGLKHHHLEANQMKALTEALALVEKYDDTFVPKNYRVGIARLIQFYSN